MKYIIRPKKSMKVTCECGSRCTANCIAKCGSLGTCFCPLK